MSRGTIIKAKPTEKSEEKMCIKQYSEHTTMKTGEQKIRFMDS